MTFIIVENNIEQISDTRRELRESRVPLDEIPC